MQLETWMKRLAHFYGLVGEARSVEGPIVPRPGPGEPLCGGETFIDPRQTCLTGYLGSHLKHASEQVDLFYNASGRLCLITHGRGSSTSVDGQPKL